MSVMEAQNRQTALSFAVYPPKTDVGMEELCGSGGVLDRLYTLKPAYIACTYGAGGADAGKNLRILDKIAADGKTPPMTHFTCVGNTAESAKNQLQNYLDHGIRRVLALRGDLSFGRTGATGGLRRAAELVSLIRREFGGQFTIAVSGNPEGHGDCGSLESDIAFLRQKQDSGADYILTRPCWDMDRFRYWLEAIRAAGIHLPVEVEVMPVVDQAETVSMALSRNGCVMPRALSELLSKNWIYPNPFVKDPFDANVEQKKADFRKAGIVYTIDQIQQYQACGVAGIHLYTQNRFADAARIAAEAGLLESRNF